MCISIWLCQEITKFKIPAIAFHVYVYNNIELLGMVPTNNIKCINFSFLVLRNMKINKFMSEILFYKMLNSCENERLCFSVKMLSQVWFMMEETNHIFLNLDWSLASHMNRLKTRTIFNRKIISCDHKMRLSVS